MTQNTDYSTIKPIHFAAAKKDKTKFNWFAFELASEIEVAVPNALKKLLAKRGYTQQTFNRSCIKLAILLQGAVLRKLTGKTSQMEISHEQVELAFPDLNDKTINKLLDCTGRAWEHLLNGCVSCPTACISNRHDYAPMFDDETFSV
jgi:hypothetical protein